MDFLVEGGGEGKTFAGLVSDSAGFYCLEK